MRLVSVSVEAIVTVLVDSDDPKEAARLAEHEMRRDPNGRPLSLVAVEALTTEAVDE